MASVYSRAVRKAAELVGGNASLARTLNVPMEEIEKWLAGEARPLAASRVPATRRS